MAAISNSLVSMRNPPSQFSTGSALKPLDQFLGNASSTNLFLNTNHVGKLQLCSSRRPLIVQAGYSDHGRPGSASIFVGGFVLGGLIFGTLTCVYAPQISKALAGPERKDLMKKLPKFIYDEDKALEKTRKELAKKIAQLNSAIDDVSGQLQSDEAPNGANVISDEIEAAI
ncbi:uncharacterized protein LOC112023636 [Quercus suber]|uniref:uncharacterized protein LOC112023636 n=1 Tax=Quercus suber TaxID=58331 RepID=UPI000CE22160|nr:uncharacterized protein LOC112023636 [Quercus suber]POF10854.1 hypothetical protein CFP56_15977 [Quercus suber]